MMPEIIIYTAKLCPYCTMAKKLFNRKGVAFSEKNIDSEPGMFEEMMLRTQRRTVPQIFIGDVHVGGFDDLHSLETKNELDPLLVVS